MESSLVQYPDARNIFDSLDVSEHTRQDYSCKIKLFLKFASEREFSRSLFLDFKRELEKRIDLKTATKNKYLISAKVFLKELSRQGFIPDITGNIKSFKENSKHKQIGLNEQEVREVEKYILNLPDTPLNLRAKVFFYLFAFQGLRQCEALRLDVSDVDLSQEILYIKGKGQDSKELVYLHPKTIEILRKYIRAAKIGSGSLFRNNSNYKNGERLNSRTVKRIFKDIFNQIGIHKSVHGFRHFYTTTLLKGGLDVRTVRKFTRHNSIETIICYDDELDIKERTPEVFKLFISQDIKNKTI